MERMKIELTPAEQRLDLEKALRDIEELRGSPDMPPTTLLALYMAWMVTRVALWTRAALVEALDGKRAACEEAHYIDAKYRKALAELEGMRHDMADVKGERDKFLAEIENGPFAGGSPFDDALNELAYHHYDQLESLTEEPSKDDPFRHQAISNRHGLGLDAFPLIEVEKTLRSADMGSYQAWRKIAHAAVLAMSYLRPLYEENGQEIEDIENECDPAPAKAS